MPTVTFTGNTTKYTISPAEMRAALATLGVTLPDTADASEGDDAYISQGGASIGLMDFHGDVILTVYDAETA